MRKQIKDTKTPKIPLNPDAIRELKKIFKYTEIITELLNNSNEKNLYEDLMKDLPLQNALIFGFKVIGMHVDNAAEYLSLKGKAMPLFWRNLHYLRNSLIHHCPTIRMPDSALELLARIALYTKQISGYFSLVCDAKNTSVDLKGQKYKVFLDVYELSTGLSQEAYPRKRRAHFTQAYYLRVVISAIQGIRALTSEIDVTNDSLQKMSTTPSQYKTYFALQNLCELIATIMNPNREYALLAESTLAAIRKQNPNIETWFRSLGISRIESMHRFGFIPNSRLAVHIQELCLMEEYLSPARLLGESSSVASSESFHIASGYHSYATAVSLFLPERENDEKVDSSRFTSLLRLGNKSRGQK